MENQLMRIYHHVSIVGNKELLNFRFDLVIIIFVSNYILNFVVTVKLLY